MSPRTPTSPGHSNRRPVCHCRGGGPRAAYCAFAEEHWRNNLLKRIPRKIRWRTRVVGAFPNDQSAFNPDVARLRHIAGTTIDQEIFEH